MQHLQSAVKERYRSALSGGHLVFSPTHLAVIHAGGVPFQLRYCPALSKKPQAPPTAQPANKPNPFLNPSKDLLVAQIPNVIPTHNIIINKFPVIPHHFILSTIVFKPQTDLLEGQDLGVAYSCLQEWEASAGATIGLGRPSLFAFFNSGEHSGASQPHRHIQFLPIEDMAPDQENDGWSLLADDIVPASGIPSRGEFHSLLTPEATEPSQTKSDQPVITSHPNLPFTHFASPISPNPTPSDLHHLYISLYNRAASAVQAYAEANPNDDPLKPTPSNNDPTATISYNLALTTKTMVLCPRRRGHVTVSVKQTSNIETPQPLGPIELNGTVLAGTFLVRKKEEWDILCSDAQEQALFELLKAIGIPRNPK
ncbi:hypothetical protein FGG08_005804 [Glutinoglossum americanum]|uniref:Uncharacterized protein n=1 Tax=Glutinoglossum americanum TaxID=1670608 RepID=A0A9P8HXR1_9PEZI|nr:hypothetical protein FGG08_005804 [Glutinoglossum americanum]